MQYKILFTGLGSIGQKHLNNVIKILKERKIDCQIDALRTKNEPFKGIDNVYLNYSDVPCDYDIVFVTNPTTLHIEAIKNLSAKTKNFFIEKPIFEKKYDCEFSKGINYVACPLRFNSSIIELKEYIEKNKIYSFRAICSSYLPDWRKNSDYTKCYSAKSSMGGGVELDLIHEIDYIKWLFGPFDKVKRISAKKSNLQITSNDVAEYILENNSVIGSLHIDYFGRKTIRAIEVFGENETKVFDLLKSDTSKMYYREMNYFFDLIEQKPKLYYNMPQEALKSVELALIN